MTTNNERALAPIREDAGGIIEAVIAKGDLSKLTPGERASYYLRTCESLGINPLVKPLDYITLNGRLTLYATRTATDQLRKIHNVTIEIVARETINDVYIVTARATLPDGRHDEEIGAVSIEGLTGDALANALMKSLTKAKRRVTLSIVGLGWLDETELETIPAARRVRVDQKTGEILDDESSRSTGTVPAPEQEQRPDTGAPPCAACHEPIRASGDYTASQIVDMTMAAYGTALCAVCARARKARKANGGAG